MSASLRRAPIFLAGLIACCPAACVPYETYQATQLQAYSLHQQYQSLAAQSRFQTDQMAAENEGLLSSLETANHRIDNLKHGLSSARERYISLLNDARDGESPLSDSTTRRFQDLDERYPEFEFDPHTGVSKFHSDILFPSGSAQISRNAIPLLREFADIMNSDDANRLNILVVGHTDDERIKKHSTAHRHPTNWHLSTNRANSVLLALSKSGIDQSRMGAAGYSKFQPVASNTSEDARSLNRRVEIYVLAPDAVVAGGWNPATHLR